MINFYDVVDSCGYDMMCTVHGRIKTLLASDDEIFSKGELVFWSEEWRNRLFTDAFHIRTHVCPLCDPDTGMFHPKLRKFEALFAGKPNHQVVEQIWKKFNKLQFMKGMCKEKFRMMLFIFQEHTNKKLKEQRLRNGYKFVPISRLTKLRNHVDDVMEFRIRDSNSDILCAAQAH